QQIKRSASPAARNYPVAGLLPAGFDAIDAAKKKSDEGYMTLKWKIGVRPFAVETAIFEKLLAFLPEAVSLRLDANGGLRKNELEGWLEVLSRNPGQIDYLEQPLPAGEEALMAELAEASGIPIALDESLNMPGRERWLTPGAWGGPLVIKPLLMGNVTPLLEKLKPLAKQIVFSSVFETGIGLFHALDLADGLPRMKYAIGFDTITAFGDDLAGLAPTPLFQVKERANMNLESIWKQLPPLS
ncbi:MAG: o-succinylbenzoate synthase, partial [Opitutales bacterium]